MKNKNFRVLLTGGGTGGHIYPALAIADGIKGKYPQTKFLYIGTKRGLEADVVSKKGIPFRAITAEGLTRKISWPALRAGLKSLKGFGEAWRLIKNFRPQVVVGTGGYVCGPVVLAAALQGIPTLIHEQNAYPGITNKLLARFADKICITFPESAKYFKAKGEIIHTGLPIRPQIIQTTRAEGAKNLKLNSRNLTLLVAGGSQGAQSLNEAMLHLYPYFQENTKFNLIHLTGPKGYETVSKKLESRGINLANCGNITIKPYLYEMEWALAMADLVIGRAGASFLAELTARGIPAILIPYPYAAENHQEHNARALEKKGAALVVLEKDLKGDKLLEMVQTLFIQEEKRLGMAQASKSLGRPEALEHIVEQVALLAGK